METEKIEPMMVLLSCDHALLKFLGACSIRHPNGDDPSITEQDLARIAGIARRDARRCQQVSQKCGLIGPDGILSESAMSLLGRRAA